MSCAKKADLVVLLDQSFDDAGGQTRLAASGGTGDQHVVAVGRELDQRAVHSPSERDPVLRESALDPAQIGGDQFVDQLDDAVPVRSLRNERCELLHRW
jgi:hypothetical protein